MVKCPICGKRVVFRRPEPKQTKRGMYEATPTHLYGNPYDQESCEPEKTKVYGCIDPHCFFEMSEEEYYSKKEIERIMGKSSIPPEAKNYDFFISYFSGTGATFAKYLKDHSEEIGSRTAFLDKEDIPKKINENMPEWRSCIDQAIRNSKTFMLIMTRRFNERREVIREYWEAIDNRIPIFLFKQKNLDAKDLCSGIGREPIDFSNLEYTEFSDECDLLTKVDERLSGKPIPQKTSWFENEAKKLIAVEGLEIKQTNEPLLEVVIGPSSNGVEWLPIITPLNTELLSMNPYCNNRCNFNAKRHYFECEPWSREKPIDFFLRVRPNGFFHLVEPLEHDESYWLDAIFGQMLQMLIYCIRVMKYKQLNTKQSVSVILRNVQGLEVRTDIHFQRCHYFFSNSEPEPFFAEFNPENGWREIGIVIKKMYEDLYREASCDIAEEVANLRLHELIRSAGINRWTFGTICLPAINVDDFGFEAIKRK
jgi:hypothetical protein